ncbi:MAG TPA: glycosyltransferase family 39 protein [Candidatus Limnocylindria bacterium]|nr:glycosyltransferase family 39 protein [Candidatus Limnocylindria bacterium]
MPIREAPPILVSTGTRETSSIEAPPDTRLASGTLGVLAAVTLLLHLLAIGQYGYFRDELYYLASTEHLDWGYVDHPPLSIALLALVRAVLGDSLPALRILSALAGVATVFLTGVIARQLGGSRFAQGIAALSVLLSPVLLATTHYYSMNAFDLLLWTLAGSLILRALDSGRPLHWASLGLIFGIGLLNKISMLWLGGGFLIALLLTSHRRVLRTPWPWLAGLLAAVMFAPHVLWQIQHGWPTLEFMTNAAARKMEPIAPLEFLLDQVLSMNPGNAPVWIAGIAFGLFVRAGRRGRVLVWIYLSVLTLLLASGRTRASYLAVAYPMLLALGAVGLERLTAAAARRWLRRALAILIVVMGLVSLPFALPVLPVESFVRYQSALGLAPGTDERHEMGVLPQHYADMFGWPEMTELVARAYWRLSPEERQRCRVFGQNYGEAGAIDVLGRRLRLPPAVSGHNSYWLWGPGQGEIDVLIIIGGDREDNARFFERIEIVGQTNSRWSMPYERGLDVSIARRPRMSLGRAWPMLKLYI